MVVFGKLATGAPVVRSAALDFLAGHRPSALVLLQRASAGEVHLPIDDQVLAEKLRAHGDPAINRLVTKIWEETTPPGEDENEMARLREIVSSGGGVPKKGEALFSERCASCHRMFNRGGLVGPDLTSYQRRDREALLLAIVTPSAEIREGYEHAMIRMKSGEIHSGFREAIDEKSVVLRQLTGQTRVLSRGEIEEMSLSEFSLMPPGLLNGLSQAEIRDLFAFLRSTTPPF
jgi:putative heme-binding domain-containing protein